MPNKTIFKCKHFAYDNNPNENKTKISTKLCCFCSSKDEIPYLYGIKEEIVNKILKPNQEVPLNPIDIPNLFSIELIAKAIPFATRDLNCHLELNIPNAIKESEKRLKKLNDRLRELNEE